MSNQPPMFEYFMKEDESEASAENYGIAQLLGNGFRDYLWRCAAELHLTPGVASGACRLAERYLSIQIRDIVATEQQPETKRMRLSELPNEFCSLVGACLIISSRSSKMMSSVTTIVTTSNYINVCHVNTRGHVSIEHRDLVTQKAKVLLTICFSVPFFNIAEKATILAKMINVPESILRSVPYIVEVADIMRDVVQKHIDAHYQHVNEAQNISLVNFHQAYPVGRMPFLPPRHYVRDLHYMAASVIATCTFILSDEDELFSFRAAQIIGSSAEVISCIANSIVSHVQLTDWRVDGNTYSDQNNTLAQGTVQPATDHITRVLEYIRSLYLNNRRE